MYRGKYRSTEHSEHECGKLYANELEKICQDIQNKGKKVGAFILESVQSCGGQVAFPSNFLALAIEIIHKYGGYVICDEV